MKVSCREADNVVADPAILAREERNTATSGQTADTDIAISTSEHSQSLFLHLCIDSLPFVSGTDIDRLLVTSDVDLVELR